MPNQHDFIEVPLVGGITSKAPTVPVEAFTELYPMLLSMLHFQQDLLGRLADVMELPLTAEDSVLLQKVCTTLEVLLPLPDPDDPDIDPEDLCEDCKTERRHGRH